MVALTSALRDRWVRTRALYSASFCRRKADGNADFARKRSDNMIDPVEANETYRAASAIAAFDAIQVAFAALVKKGILSKAEAEQIRRQAIETIQDRRRRRPSRQIARHRFGKDFQV